MNEALAFEFDLPHAPEKVWRAITEPALVSEWLLPLVDGAIARDQGFTLQAPAKEGWDGRVHCRVLDSDPPHRLRYAWVVGPLDTVVTFTLTPRARGTHMVLVHAGFAPDQKQNLGGARYGWRMMGERLETLLGRMA